jgi:hypothetical protein
MSITLPTRTVVPASATPSPVRTNPAAMRSRPTTRTRIPNNRHPYLAWGTAWLVGYGAFALAGGDNPVVAMPGLLPTVLLTGGLIAAATVTTVATIRDQRGVAGPAKTAGTLFGAAWATGFTALALLITALGQTLDNQLVHTLLWPTGSAIVVGLLYLMGGTLQRDPLQYTLGTYLALLGAGAVFLDSPGHYWMLAIAGAPAYFVAAAVEGRRRTTAIRRDITTEHDQA